MYARGVPRAGWVKPESDQRLSDHISIGVLTRTFPLELVDGVVEAAGRREVRNRLLPARVVVYYLLAMALFSDASYEEVMRLLVQGLSWSEGWRSQWQVPSKTAIYKARLRLGVEPMEALFRAVASPLATPETPGGFWRGLRLLTVDGTCLDVADTDANDAAFGRPGSGRGTRRGAFPQVRLVALGECGSHAIVRAVIGPYTTGEQRLVAGLVDALGPGMLVIADRAFASAPFADAIRQTGAEFVVRTKHNSVLPVDETYPDGSFQSRIYHAADRHQTTPIPVRAIEYQLTSEPDATSYRLITNLLDPDQAPALELAALYSERWEIESAFDELKTHQRGPRLVLRSKTPDGARQEVWAYLCVHYAIRHLMHTAATTERADPDRFSFIRSLRVARRTTGTHPGFSP